MSKVLKSSLFYTLLLVISYLLVADYLPSVIHQYIYTTSVIAQEILMWLIPFIAFVFVACSIISLQKKAPFFIVILMLFVFFMSFIGTWYALFCAKFITNLTTLSQTHSKVIYVVEPLFRLPFKRPTWWSTDYTCLLGLIVAMVLIFSNNRTLINLSDKIKSILQKFLVSFVSKIVLVFILGFIVQMHQSRLIGISIEKYGEFILWLLFILILYCIIAGIISNKGNIAKAISDLQRLISPAMIAATSGSSLISMPWTIAATSKNLQDPKVANLVIPITTNIMMIGDCILNAFLCFLIYNSFYSTLPTFSMLWNFSIMFVVMRFAGAAVLGGVIYLMLPIYEAHLHFTSDMLLLILTFNVLLDPIDGFFNVLTKGIACKIFEIVWLMTQKLNKFVFKRVLISLTLITILIILGTVMKFTDFDSTKPPIALKIEHKTTVHDTELVDNYHWLRDSNWPQIKDKNIISYINDENKYADSVLSEHQEIKEKIYQELRSRVLEDDISVPVKWGQYFYYTKVKKDQEYWIFVRKKIKENDVIKYPSDVLTRKDIIEEVLLDPNEIKKNLKVKYINIGNKVISPKHDILAYSFDVKGDERYTIRVKNLEKNLYLDDVIDDVMPNIVWHENNEGFFYIPAGKNWRAQKVYYHKIGTQQKDDILIYHEKVEGYTVQISKSESDKYLFIKSVSSEDNEVLYLDLLSSELNFKLHSVMPKRSKILYDVTHNNNNFYILTNDVGENFRLMMRKTDLSNISSKEDWSEVIPHSDDEYIADMHMYHSNLVLVIKRDGLKRIKIFSIERNGDISFEREVLFQDDSYDSDIIFTTFDAASVRYYYTSLRIPYSIKESSFSDSSENLLKTQLIPSGFDENEYVVERIWANNDGVKIPISVVYKKELFKADGSNPLLLYGYGSYGISIPAAFNANIISLLDRGFVFAIAHIRGGDDFGFKWYNDGKLLSKKNTFDDFVAVANHLIEKNYTKKGNIAIKGGSAGGLLVTAVMNMHPELFKTVIALVPFVDVLNTMLDDTLPLTPMEYKEWGDPRKKEFFDYIKSYSPYDNIKAQYYPNIFIRSGLSDPRVTYWEPIKFIAKLRNLKSDNNLVILRTDINAGHKGASGRFSYLNDIAEEYVFILKTFNLMDMI